MTSERQRVKEEEEEETPCDGESFETTRPHRLPLVFFISGGERVFGTIRESDFTEHFDDDDDKNERVFSR